MFATSGYESSLAPPGDDSIMELSLMISRRQFDALEQRAASEGMSVAKFLRRLVKDSIDDEAPASCR